MVMPIIVDYARGAWAVFCPFYALYAPCKETLFDLNNYRINLLCPYSKKYFYNLYINLTLNNNLLVLLLKTMLKRVGQLFDVNQMLSDTFSRQFEDPGACFQERKFARLGNKKTTRRTYALLAILENQYFL